MIDWEEISRKHELWHSFVGYCNEVIGKSVNELQGWDDIQAVQRFAQEHTMVVEAGVDDSVFCSSNIFLFPHPTMGTSVVYIPQCSGVQNEFFLYPGHLKGLIRALEQAEVMVGEEEE